MITIVLAYTFGRHDLADVALDHLPRSVPATGVVDLLWLLHQDALSPASMMIDRRVRPVSSPRRCRSFVRRAVRRDATPALARPPINAIDQGPNKESSRTTMKKRATLRNIRPAK